MGGFESPETKAPENFRLAGEALREKMKGSYHMWGTGYDRDQVVQSYIAEFRKLEEYTVMKKQDEKWTEEMAESMAQGAWDDYREFAQKNKRPSPEDQWR